MDEARKPFEHYALVELFGHQRIAGKVTEAEIGGGKFIRVDVPAIGDAQPLTRFYSPGAIYGITPVTEETALALAAQFRVEPITPWEAKNALEVYEAKQKQRELPGRTYDDEEDDIPL